MVLLVDRARVCAVARSHPHLLQLHDVDKPRVILDLFDICRAGKSAHHSQHQHQHQLSCPSPPARKYRAQCEWVRGSLTVEFLEQNGDFLTVGGAKAVQLVGVLPFPELRQPSASARDPPRRGRKPARMPARLPLRPCPTRGVHTYLLIESGAGSGPIHRPHRACRRADVR